MQEGKAGEEDEEGQGSQLHGDERRLDFGWWIQMMYYRIVHMMLLTDAIPINLIFKKTTLNTSVKKKKKVSKRGSSHPTSWGELSGSS